MSYSQSELDSQSSVHHVPSTPQLPGLFGKRESPAAAVPDIDNILLNQAMPGRRLMRRAPVAVSPFSTFLLREFSSQDSYVSRRAQLLQDSQQSNSYMSPLHRVPNTPVTNQTNPIFTQIRHGLRETNIESTLIEQVVPSCSPYVSEEEKANTSFSQKKTVYIPLDEKAAMKPILSAKRRQHYKRTPRNLSNMTSPDMRQLRLFEEDDIFV